MSLFYSAARGGFFDDTIHADLPDDAVAITAQEHRALLEGQSSGKRIVAGPKGKPRLAPRFSLSLADRRARAVSGTRDEAQRRIVAIASVEAQSNDNALIALQALQFAQAGTSTIDAAAAIDRRARIDRVRAASNALQESIEAMNAAALTVFEPANPSHWPN